MTTEEYASAGAGTIRCRIWEPGGAAKGIVQLVHGIAEHTARYADFAEYLTKNGYIVAAEDHMGHGESISDALPRGCIRGGWDAMTADVHALTERAKQRRSELPFFLLGHSMGSFLARTFLYTYPQEQPGSRDRCWRREGSSLPERSAAAGRIRPARSCSS